MFILQVKKMVLSPQGQEVERKLSFNLFIPPKRSVYTSVPIVSTPEIQY